MKYKVTTLLCIAALIPAIVFSAPKKRSVKVGKKATTTTAAPAVKKKSDYEKLFDGKKRLTRKGFITLHKVDSVKLLLEIPKSVFGREMLLGSTISEISSNEHGAVGYKPGDPLHVMFTMMGGNIQLRRIYSYYEAAPGDPGISDAVKRSSLPSIYASFKIEAYNADSSNVVIDATDLFLSENPDLTPFDPYSKYARPPYTRQVMFERSKSFLSDIKAFDDNVTVKSYLSYSINLSQGSGASASRLEKKSPFTALVTRTLMLLPEKPMRPRIADSRMNIFTSRKALFSSDMNAGTKPLYLAQHWRLEPSDTAAFKKGELTAPAKPITFYIDKNFPEDWKPYIREGILEWNKPFEAIGFKDAVRALDYPTDDPEFDPDNLKYSCLRYVPISIMNAMGPSWDDPRTGELVSASVMVYNDVTRLIAMWRYLQTAAADTSVRRKELPKEVMGDALRNVISHEIGHCLGFMHNMASSAAIPTDSLRSASFTQKYGTTVSIMDYARYNHVAQPGDGAKGVKMTPPRMGVYDYYAVKWLYSPIFDAATAKDEVPTLDKWISEKAADPVYRYGKQQFTYTLDPTAQNEDLGDDLVKAGEYGVRNLRLILENTNKWVAADDKDLAFREFMYTSLINQYLRFMLHAYNVKGGLMLNERKEGDPRPSYSFIDGDYQRRAQKFLCDQLKDLDWIENNPLTKEISMQGNLSISVQRLIVSMIVAGHGAMGRLTDPAKNAYTPQENADMAFKAIFDKTLKGQTLSPRDMTNQIYYIDVMLGMSGLKNEVSVSIVRTLSDFAEAGAAADAGGHHGHNCRDKRCGMFSTATGSDLLSSLLNGETSGFERQRPLSGYVYPQEPLCYGKVMKAKELLTRMKNTGSKETRTHYSLLLQKIESAMK